MPVRTRHRASSLGHVRPLTAAPPLRLPGSAPTRVRSACRVPRRLPARRRRPRTRSRRAPPVLGVRMPSGGRGAYSARSRGGAATRVSRRRASHALASTSPGVQRRASSGGAPMSDAPTTSDRPVEAPPALYAQVAARVASVAPQLPADDQHYLATSTTARGGPPTSSRRAPGSNWSSHPVRDGVVRAPSRGARPRCRGGPQPPMSGAARNSRSTRRVRDDPSLTLADRPMTCRRRAHDSSHVRLRPAGPVHADPSTHHPPNGRARGWRNSIHTTQPEQGSPPRACRRPGAAGLRAGRPHRAAHRAPAGASARTAERPAELHDDL
jgi:hypothetical protein